jgi:hypothetical protein
MPVDLHPLCQHADRCVVCRARVYVPSDDELRTIPAYHALAIATAALPMGRRDIPDWAMERLYAHQERLFWDDGSPFEVGDEAFDIACNNDGSFRWLSSLIAFAENPPKQRPHETILPRLRLLALAHMAAALDEAGETAMARLPPSDRARAA